MTTSDHNLNPFGDISMFEPEALLATVPGDHPRAAAALASVRSGAETGHLDIAALARIAGELYAEGFPPGSPLSIPANQGIPSTAEFAEAPNTTSGIADIRNNPVSNLIKPHSISVSEGLCPSAPTGQLIPDSGMEIPFASELSKLLQTLRIGSAASEFVGVRGPASNEPLTSAPTQAYYFLGHQPALAAEPHQLSTSGYPGFDANLLRRDFPILSETVNGRPLIWFDNAATTQKPQAVIDRVSYFYQHENSNIHRAAHELAARATDAYEEARETVRRFINASSPKNIVFVRGTTEAINLVSQSWGKKHIAAGDEILITHLEHHANIVPWQMLCAQTGARLKVVPVDDSGQVIIAEYQRLLTPKTKLVSFTQVSNALGTVTPAREMIEIAHRNGTKVLLDAAQSVSHMQTDVAALGCDFLVFSGHKVFGPTGIGALYGTDEVLEDMPPWQGGGNMIEDVTFDHTVYQPAPAKLEAGTGNIADAVGLGAALRYVERIGIVNIARYEHELLVYATAALERVPGLKLVGTARDKASVLSFNLSGFASEDVGRALNSEGIAVRSGHHCAQPILRRFGIETTVRASLAFYNTPAEVDVMLSTLLKLTSGKSHY